MPPADDTGLYKCPLEDLLDDTFDRALKDVMQAWDIPGVSIALVRAADGVSEELIRCYGLRNRVDPVTEDVRVDTADTTYGPWPVVHQAHAELLDHLRHREQLQALHGYCGGQGPAIQWVQLRHQGSRHPPRVRVAGRVGFAGMYTRGHAFASDGSAGVSCYMDRGLQ